MPPIEPENSSRRELLDRLWEKAMGNIFVQEPNLCCTNNDVTVLADLGTGDSRQELVKCPGCDEKWTRCVS